VAEYGLTGKVALVVAEWLQTADVVIIDARLAAAPNL